MGVSRTATTLGLSYYSLKRRCAEVQQQRDSSAVLELPSASLAGRECVIELESVDGSKMRIQLKGELPDIASLAERFWGDR